MNTQTESNLCVLDAEEPEEKTIFTFDELDDSAKDKVRQWHAEGLGDFKWWEFCEEDFKERAKAKGFDVGRTYFSLSYSQSDHADFDGEFRVEGKAAEDLLCQRDLQRWALIKAASALGCGETLTLVISCDIKESSIEGPVEIETVEGITDEVEDDFAAFSWDCSVETEITELVRDLSHEYYKALREEYEYLTSDEAISEACEANEWMFDEEGNLL